MYKPRSMQWLVTDTLGGDGDALRNYVRWLEGASIESVFVRPFAAPADLGAFSALLLTGGGDVDAALYRETLAPATRGVNRDRDELEKNLIEAFLAAGKPVFGICRGIQVLNVARGGKLIQHIPDVLAGRANEEHSQVQRKDSVHPVRFAEGSMLAEVLSGVTEVNSSHHQAVGPEALGKNLRIAAWSGAGIVEAVEGVGFPAPVIGVQWHPERWHQNASAAEKLLRWWKDLASPSGR